MKARNLAIGAAILALIAGAVYFTQDLGRHDGIPTREFDRAAWATGDRRTRGSMVPDLERSQLLIGLDRPAVLHLLGAPDTHSADSDVLSYEVDLGLRTGPWGIGGTWPFTTTVRFDQATARVVEVSTRD